MQYLFMALFAAGIVAADQITKFLVLENIALYETVPVWEGMFRLTYVQNFGAAFSSFQGMRWLFVVIFVLFTAVNMCRLFLQLLFQQSFCVSNSLSYPAANRRTYHPGSS